MEGIQKVAEAIQDQGSKDAVNISVAEQYIGEFGKLAKETNTLILPSNVADVSGMVATLTKTFESVKS